MTLDGREDGGTHFHLLCGWLEGKIPSHLQDNSRAGAHTDKGGKGVFQSGNRTGRELTGSHGGFTCRELAA
jgi:hypothetical protein